MFKVGLQFSYDKVLTEKLHQYLTKVCIHLSSTNEHFKIEENNHRQTYRVPIYPDFPSGLQISATLTVGNVKYPCKIIDMSAGGLAAIVNCQIGMMVDYKLTLSFNNQQFDCDVQARWSQEIKLNKRVRLQMEREERRLNKAS